MNDTDPLKATWHAKPNDLIGGWCVMDVDHTPALAGRPEIADFTIRAHAEHIADLHNERLAREHWHHAPPSSPYTRLHDYGNGADEAPSRKDVMELLRSFNAATAMNGVHRRTLGRAWERLDMANRAPGPTGLTRVWSGYDDDECWFPMFADLADAKAYAEQAYEAQCTASGLDADRTEVTWGERKAYTEEHGYPGMYDLGTGTGWVVCEQLVHANLASGLAQQPIERETDTTEPVEQVPGQQQIPAAPCPDCHGIGYDLGGDPANCTTCRGYKAGDLVEITEPVDSARGAHIAEGHLGRVTEIDDDPEHPISLTVDGFDGLAWCSSGEIRHADEVAS